MSMAMILSADPNGPCAVKSALNSAGFRSMEHETSVYMLGLPRCLGMSKASTIWCFDTMCSYFVRITYFEYLRYKHHFHTFIAVELSLQHTASTIKFIVWNMKKRFAILTVLTQIYKYLNFLNEAAFTNCRNGFTS